MKRLLGNFLLFAAMAVGLLTGWANIPILNETATVTSDLFLRLLKLISLPIIFLAVTSTITGMKSFHEMRRMGRKVLTYTLGTTLVAATVALLLYVLIDPASSAQGAEGGILPEVAKPASYFSFVLNIVPSNYEDQDSCDYHVEVRLARSDLLNRDRSVDGRAYLEVG